MAQKSPGVLQKATKDLAAIHNRSPAGRAGSKDGDLMSSMVSRLQKLEAMNAALKNELKEKKEDAFEDQPVNISMEENKVIQKV